MLFVQACAQGQQDCLDGMGIIVYHLMGDNLKIL